MKANILINESIKGNISRDRNGVWSIHIPDHTIKPVLPLTSLDNTIAYLSGRFQTNDIQVLFVSC